MPREKALELARVLKRSEKDCLVSGAAMWFWLTGSETAGGRDRNQSQFLHEHS